MEFSGFLCIALIWNDKTFACLMFIDHKVITILWLVLLISTKGRKFPNAKASKVEKVKRAVEYLQMQLSNYNISNHEN